MSSSSKRIVFLATINNWKKEFLWFIVELENNLPSSLFCKVWNMKANWKVFEGMMANLFPKVKQSLDISIHPELFCHKAVLKNLAKFTEKHLCQDSGTGVFLWILLDF